MVEVPKLTDLEAMSLRVRLQHPATLTKADARITMLGLDDENVSVGERALAAYDSSKREEIERPLRERIARQRAWLRRFRDSSSSVVCPECRGLWSDESRSYDCYADCALARELGEG